MKNFLPSFKPLLLFSLYSFLLLLSSCVELEKFNELKAPSRKYKAKTTSKEEKKTWQEIKKEKNKNFTERIKDISVFIKANKDKDIVLEAYLLKAKIFSKNKKQKEACSTYHQVVKSSFYYPKPWEAYRASAKCYFNEGKTELAFEVLEKFIQSPKENLEHKTVAADLQWVFIKNKKGFIERKLISLSHLLLLSSQPKQKQYWEETGKNIIDSLLVKELILQAQQAEKFIAFEGYLLYKTGQYFWSNKKFSTAGKFFKKSLSTTLSLKLKKQAQYKINLIQKISKVNPYLIGVLVPLSGRSKALGEKILKGLYLGLDMDKDSSWQILVMDSKSHPDVVRTHLDSLFYKHHVIGIVGGFTSETAEVIASRAEAFLTPAVLFSQKEGLTLNREFIFQNSITAEQLLSPLAEQNKLKIEKVAILYPDDLYGKNYADIFSKIFRKKGGQIVGQEAYKAGEVDFKSSVKNLLHLNIKGREKEFKKLKQKYLKGNPSLTERSHKLTPENLLPAKKEFEALFIPDSLDRVKKITDHLKYFGVKDIYLLGTNLWSLNQSSFWSKEFPLIFVNLQKKDNHLVRKSSFYKEFINSFGQPPGLFEQRAYNTALFFKKALSQGVKSRLSFQEELKKIKQIQGAYYSLTISKDRIFNYPLSLYKKDSKKIHTLDSMPVK